MKALILGDLSPTACTNEIFEKKNIDALFHDMVSLFEGNDINFVNLECALTDAEKSIEKFGPPLKACKEVADVLKSVGVNVCGLSNNHIFDFGIKGAEDTMKELDRCGMAIAKGEEKEKILAGFEKRNAELANGEWINGWREFCQSMADTYLKSAQSAAGLDFDSVYASAFAHHLDCEAHTDVWRELFKTANYRNEI